MRQRPKSLKDRAGNEEGREPTEIAELTQFFDNSSNSNLILSFQGVQESDTAFQQDGHLGVRDGTREQCIQGQLEDGAEGTVVSRLCDAHKYNYTQSVQFALLF